jgi:hypothetical protein
VISDYHRGNERFPCLTCSEDPRSLMQAMEKYEPGLVKSAIVGAKFTGNPRIHIPCTGAPTVSCPMNSFKTFLLAGA